MKYSYEDIIKKYKSKKFFFSSYYKYIFLFQDETKTINIYCGGNSDEIYEFEVKNNESYLITDLPVYQIYENHNLVYEKF